MHVFQLSYITLICRRSIASEHTLELVHFLLIDVGGLVVELHATACHTKLVSLRIYTHLGMCVCHTKLVSYMRSVNEVGYMYL
jgi:hypothetical protein